MDHDATDGFFQQLDSEDVLNRHGPGLVDQARDALRVKPDRRVAGLIAFQDAREAGPLRGISPAGQGKPRRQPVAARTPGFLLVCSRLFGIAACTSMDRLE